VHSEAKKVPDSCEAKGCSGLWNWGFLSSLQRNCGRFEKNVGTAMEIQRELGHVIDLIR
jgi:hypothetical protein